MKLLLVDDHPMLRNGLRQAMDQQPNIDLAGEASTGALAVKLAEELKPELVVNSCRPAVDVLFRSVAAAYGGAVLGVVMTGMGQDGLRGCEIIHERRGTIVVQDEATSIVWSMPGYVAKAVVYRIQPDQPTATCI